MDLITELPETESGGKHLVVCVDTFSKWCEVGVLPDRRASTVANWFYLEIISRFGKPEWVRTDQGVEFRKQFEDLLRSSGIGHKIISVQHSQANGQAERYNRIFRSAIRKYLAMYPGAIWDEFLPEILMGIRFCTTRSHGFSPYFLIFGQEPTLPITAAASFADPLVLDPMQQVQREEEYAAELAHRIAELRECAYARILKEDEAAKAYYRQKVELERRGLDYMFNAGDSCYIRQRRQGKMLPKALGPYKFVEYHGATASVERDDGRVIRCHISQIAPCQ